MFRREFNAGDLVSIASAWQNGFESSIYRVVEWNCDRGFISPVDWGGAIAPTELVRNFMLVMVDNQ